MIFMESLLKVFNRTIKHELISGSFYVFVGFLISSFILFLFNLYLARGLSYSDYGNYSSLLSIFTLATIPAGSLSIVMVKFAATYFANNQMDQLSAFYKKSLIFWSTVSLTILLLYIMLSYPISHFLKINDHRAIITMGGAIALSYLGISNAAFLQAMIRFKSVSFVSVSGALSRLASGFILLSNNLRVFGATMAILLATIVSLLFGTFSLRSLLTHKSESKVELHTREIIKYGLPASIAILFLSSFVSSDVVLVKHFFTPEEAGHYGGLSLVGKVIFYFTGPIPMVMFPLLVKRDAKGENVRTLLHLSLLLVLLASVSISIFYFLFPNFTIKLFLGGRDYLNIASYLGFFGIFLTIYSANNVFLNFFLSVKKTSVLYLVGLAAALQIGLIILSHKNFQDVITSSVISSLLLFLALLLYYIKVYGLHNSSK